MEKPLDIDLTYWAMALVVGVVKFIEAYRRSGPGGNDVLLASADGLTAIAVWRALSGAAIGIWSAAQSSGIWPHHLPVISDETFSALAVLVALFGVRQVMAALMRFKIVKRELTDETT